MEQESTSELMKILKDAGKDDIGEYNSRHLSGVCSDFTVYMDSLIAEKHLKRQDIFQKADLPQKYGYKLLGGESRTRDRDKLLRIFIAMGLNLKETQRALELYGMPALYPRIRRDAVIIIAVNRGVSSVDTVNEWLSEHGENELSRSAD
jgi:hypothetical protein